MTVDDELRNEGDSMIMELKAGVEDTESAPGNDGEVTTPGAGKDGESTIIPGISAGRLTGAFFEGPAT